MIYKMTQKDLKKEMKEFNKTAYGKIVLTLSYAIPCISILFSILSFVMSYCYWWYAFLFGIAFPVGMIITIVTFVIGTVYYYKELKEYIHSKKM